MKNLTNEMLSFDKRFVTYNMGKVSFNQKDRTNFFKDYIVNKSIVDDRDCFYIPTKHNLFIPENFIQPEHEIAHILEMKDNARIVQVDFGFKQHTTNKEKGTVHLQDCKSSSAYFAALARESRVIAIQTIITGQNLSAAHLSKGRFENSLWEHICQQKHLNYSKFKTIEQVTEWTAHIVLKTYQSWNQDKVMEVWKNKVEYIQNWMESK